MDEAGDSITDRLADAERRRMLTRHKGTSKPKVPKLGYALPDFNAIADRLLELLTTTVVSAAIDAPERRSLACRLDPSRSDVAP